jgi:hypothetical protein
MSLLAFFLLQFTLVYSSEDTLQKRNYSISRADFEFKSVAVVDLISYDVKSKNLSFAPYGSGYNVMLESRGDFLSILRKNIKKDFFINFNDNDEIYFHCRFSLNKHPILIRSDFSYESKFGPLFPIEKPADAIDFLCLISQCSVVFFNEKLIPKLGEVGVIDIAYKFFVKELKISE